MKLKNIAILNVTALSLGVCLATILKYRIRKPRHKFDTLGRMTLPPEDMDLIDQQIVQHLLDN